MKRTQLGWSFIIIIPIIYGLVLTQKQDVVTLALFGLFSIILLLLFYQLTIQVTNEAVKFSLGIGIIRGSYKLSDIKHCKSIAYTPFGWGIRLRYGAILFNVSGNKAIELEVRNKTRKIWIGTDSPEEIASFINSKINQT
jgi:hypothetical protein